MCPLVLYRNMKINKTNPEWTNKNSINEECTCIIHAWMNLPSIFKTTQNLKQFFLLFLDISSYTYKIPDAFSAYSFSFSG